MGRIMRQGERTDLSAFFAECSVPRGRWAGAAFIRQVFGAAPSHLHSTNLEFAVPGIWSLKGPTGSTEIASL